MEHTPGYLAKVVILVIMFLSVNPASVLCNQSFISTSLRNCGRDSIHSPKKAAMLSALLPGAGQAYNRKYWKMPVIYTAGAAGAYFIIENADSYKSFRQAYKYRLDDDPATVDEYTQLSAQQLQVYRDSYRRNMELSVIFSTVVYLLQILDATVDAHLFDFDVTNDLAFNWRPVLMYGAHLPYSVSAGVSFTLGLKYQNAGSNPFGSISNWKVLGFKNN